MASVVIPRSQARAPISPIITRAAMVIRATLRPAACQAKSPNSASTTTCGAPLRAPSMLLMSQSSGSRSGRTASRFSKAHSFTPSAQSSIGRLRVSNGFSQSVFFSSAMVVFSFQSGGGGLGPVVLIRLALYSPQQGFFW